MTDPFDALRPIARPLPVGGDERAVTRGRRIIHRRRLGYTGVASAGILAVGAAATLNHGGSPHDSIHFLDPSVSPEPTPTEASPSPSQVPGPRPTLTVVTETFLPPVGPSPSESPAETVAPTPAPTPRGPYVGQEPTASDGGAVVRRTASTDNTFCATGAQQEVQPGSDGWCSAVTGPARIVAGERATYAFELCRDVSAGAGTLHFATRKEVDFRALSDGGTRHAWYADHAANFTSDAHELTLGAGACMTWTTTWSGQDDDGYAVPEALYEVDAWPYATEYVGHEGQTAPPVGYTSVQVRWA